MILNIPENLLDGAVVDCGYKFDFADTIFDSNRERAIYRLCKDKKVVHLGACDHKDLIKPKIEAGCWLHKILTDNTKKCVGFDINGEAVSYCNELGYDNIFCMNMASDYVKCYSKLIDTPPPKK